MQRRESNTWRRQTAPHAPLEEARGCLRPMARMNIHCSWVVAQYSCYAQALRFVYYVLLMIIFELNRQSLLSKEIDL
jgi:hypothetical protein